MTKENVAETKVFGQSFYKQKETVQILLLVLNFILRDTFKGTRPGPDFRFISIMSAKLGGKEKKGTKQHQ